VSEAFADFQRYVRMLKSRGIVLAVCSANEESNAKEPFEAHPGMVLGLDDISCFVANWKSKASNLEAIADSLNLGLDSFVFVDDDPAQRSLVRRSLPAVEVPEMPADPAEYVRALSAHRYFQLVSLSAEDVARTESYRANTERTVLRETTESVDAFLASLQMVSRTLQIGDLEAERSTQLINRSNQFNLTTRRRSLPEVQALAADAGWITRCVFLSDRFGDNGLISVLLARREGEGLEIDTWVMSCRVLRRGVESQLMAHLVEEARRLGIDRVLGKYVPSPKNALVADHFEKLGFEQTAVEDDGTTRWTYVVPEGRPGPKTFIRRDQP
jgi:FkbH-like protein